MVYNGLWSPHRGGKSGGNCGNDELKKIKIKMITLAVHCVIPHASNLQRSCKVSPDICLHKYDAEPAIQIPQNLGFAAICEDVFLHGYARALHVVSPQAPLKASGAHCKTSSPSTLHHCVRVLLILQLFAAAR